METARVEDHARGLARQKLGVVHPGASPALQALEHAPRLGDVRVEGMLAAVEFLLNKMQDTKTNAKFFEAMKRILDRQMPGYAD